MIVVVARQDDPFAEKLAFRLGGRAAILTPADLSAPGWRLDPARPHTARGVVNGHRVDAGDIGGVVTLLPAVVGADIPNIADEDREYAAAEMTAFLLSWMSGLTCPMLNRPTPECLSGPAWTAERWALTARKHGVPVWPLRRRLKAESRASRAAWCWDSTTSITVIGERCIGSGAGELSEYARRLAVAASAKMLTVEFGSRADQAAVSGVTLYPDLSNLAVSDAIASYFEGALR